jgi:hypothetical protein
VSTYLVSMHVGSVTRDSSFALHITVQVGQGIGMQGGSTAPSGGFANLTGKEQAGGPVVSVAISC